MTEQPFETALAEFKDAIRAAITRVPLDQQPFDDFTDLFAADFAHVLGGLEGEAIWRRDRTNLVNLGRYLGTIAEMYAVTAVPPTSVGDAQLRDALNVIKPRCKLGLPDPTTQQRLCYCLQVN